MQLSSLHLALAPKSNRHELLSSHLPLEVAYCSVFRTGMQLYYYKPMSASSNLGQLHFRPNATGCCYKTGCEAFKAGYCNG